MSDPAAAGSAPASALFVGIGVAGAALGLLAEIFVRRTLPQLAGSPTLRMRSTTAAAAFALSALLAWRFGTAPELPAYVLLAVAGVQLARIDLLHHLLPNRMVLPLLGGRNCATRCRRRGVRRGR